MSTTGTLAAARHARAARDAAEVALARATVDYCAAHWVSDEDQAAWVAGYGEHGLALGGSGCPLVAESAVIEYAAALGLSTPAGQSYVADVLEIRYRLPRLWGRVVAGGCPVWRARAVAKATANLCEDGADYVDTHVAGFAHSLSAAQLERVVDDALSRFETERAEEKRKADAEARRADLDLDHVSEAGVVEMRAALDLPDALDLEHALRDGATALRELGCEESLNVRRSLALGELARGQATLGVSASSTTGDCSTTGDGSTTGGISASSTNGREGRSVVLHVHLSADAVAGGFHGTPASEAERARVGDVHGVRRSLLTQAVRDWCRTAAKITVRPVLDLTEAIHAESYEAPVALRAQTEIRDRTCVFPHCTRPAVHCDMEHADPWPTGQTATHNIAPACRRHHRAKTHMRWTYTVLTPGLYLWTSPTGLRYLRSHAGTHDLDPVSTSSTTGGVSTSSTTGHDSTTEPAAFEPLPETSPPPRWRPLPRTIDPPRGTPRPHARAPVDTTPPPF